MSTILIINAGSSSVKFQIVKMPSEELVTTGIVERIGLEEGMFTIKFNNQKNVINRKFADHNEAINFVLNQFIEFKVLNSLDEITACGHRVAHGGEYFKASHLADEKAEQEVKKLFTLAPLHNPVNFKGYEIISEALPNIKNVFVFDTSFHSTIQAKSFVYPIPYKYYEDYKIRKYGFHGTSHRYVSEVVYQTDPSIRSLITCHIGNGVSLCAIDGGISVNTSMGVTPLGGAMMGTRSGDIDPAIVDQIANIEGIDACGTVDILNKKSGMLGVSGISSDARDVIEAAKNGDYRANLTLEIYAGRIRSYIGRYLIQLKGLDSLAFTAGVGENSAFIRSMVLDGLKDALGIEYDQELNEKNGDENGIISTPNSKVKVFVIATNEEIMIARDTYNLTK